MISLETVSQGFKSTDWNKRTEAFQLLLSVNSAAEIQRIGNFLLRESDQVFKSYFIKAARKYIHLDNLPAVTQTLHVLVLLCEDKNNKLVKEVQTLLDFFYISHKILFAKKIEATRGVLDLLGKDSSKYLLKKIAQSKLIQLKPYLLKLLEFQMINVVPADIIPTITTLKMLEEKRIRWHLTKILTTSTDEKLLSVCLDAIGDLGSWFDYFVIKKYFTHSSALVRIKSFSACISLLGKRSAAIIYRYYKDEKVLEVKEHIIKLLAQVDHKKGITFLLKILLVERSAKLLLRIYWAIESLPPTTRGNSLLQYFNAADERARIKLMPLMNLSHKEEYYQAVFLCAKRSDNILLQTSAIDTLVSFNRKESLSFLIALAKNYANPLAYYALDALFKHDCIPMEEILEEFISRPIPDGSLFHELLLDIIARRIYLEYPSQTVEDYVLSKLQSSSTSNRYLALLALEKIITIKCFQRLLVFVKEEKDPQLIASSFRTFNFFLQARSSFLLENDIIFKDNFFFDKILPHRVDQALIGILCQLISQNGIQSYSSFILFFQASIKMLVEMRLSEELSEKALDTYVDILLLIAQPISSDNQHLLGELYLKVSGDNLKRKILLFMRETFDSLPVNNFLQEAYYHPQLKQAIFDALSATVKRIDRV